MVKKCLLLRFGIIKVDKYVEYRVHPNPDYVYVYFDNDWHTVPKDDVIIVNHQSLPMVPYKICLFECWVTSFWQFLM